MMTRSKDNGVLQTYMFTRNISDPKKNLFHAVYLIIISLIFTLLLMSCDRQEDNRSPVQETQEKTEPEYQGTIIAVGDSLTAGLGVDQNNAWPYVLEEKLHENGFNWQIINAGISGETSSGALSRMKWILAQKPDIVILETGANDGLRGIPVSVIKENIRKAVQLLKENNVTVILAGMQIVQNLGAEYSQNFAGIFPEIAGDKKIVLIPFLLQGVAGEPSLNQADSIHPNEAGHKIIAETVYPYVLEAINKNN